MSDSTRREFIEKLALATGGIVLVPIATSCGGKASPGPATAASPPAEQPASGELPPVPQTRPADWDPIAFNRTRGNAGAIPESYLPSINGPDGVTAHLGKHLPYLPETGATSAPEGFVALMWGDPDKGYVRHPNAVKSDANDNHGHWYNWIRIRKAANGDAQEVESVYTSWPTPEDSDNGSYAVFGGGDITSDSGKNTIYLSALPADVGPGDTVRIWAHCLTHGEYVDFVTI